MTIAESHFRDFVEFVFIINKYLLFFDMQIYILLLKNNNFIKKFDKYLFFVPVGGFLATCFLLSSTQTVLNVDSNVTTMPAVRKYAHITDDLTQNLRLIRKSAHFTDKRTQKIQATIKSQQFWGKIERPQITFSLKLNLYDKMLSMLDI